jgi:hypothetical protein
MAKMPTSTSVDSQRKGNLLDGFELDDLGDLFLFDRRQLNEPRKAGLTTQADRDSASLCGVPLRKILKRALNQ